jgi:hypothetical protein
LLGGQTKREREQKGGREGEGGKESIGLLENMEHLYDIIPKHNGFGKNQKQETKISSGITK